MGQEPVVRIVEPRMPRAVQCPHCGRAAGAVREGPRILADGACPGSLPARGLARPDGLRAVPETRVFPRELRGRGDCVPGRPAILPVLC